MKSFLKYLAILGLSFLCSQIVFSSLDDNAQFGRAITQKRPASIDSTAELNEKLRSLAKGNNPTFLLIYDPNLEEDFYKEDLELLDYLKYLGFNGHRICFYNKKYISDLLLSVDLLIVSGHTTDYSAILNREIRPNSPELSHFLDLLKEILKPDSLVIFSGCATPFHDLTPDELRHPLARQIANGVPNLDAVCVANSAVNCLAPLGNTLSFVQAGVPLHVSCTMIHRDTVHSAKDYFDFSPNQIDIFNKRLTQLLKAKSGQKSCLLITCEIVSQHYAKHIQSLKHDLKKLGLVVKELTIKTFYDLPNSDAVPGKNDVIIISGVGNSDTLFFARRRDMPKILDPSFFGAEAPILNPFTDRASIEDLGKFVNAQLAPNGLAILSTYVPQELFNAPICIDQTPTCLSIPGIVASELTADKAICAGVSTRSNGIRIETEGEAHILCFNTPAVLIDGTVTNPPKAENLLQTNWQTDENIVHHDVSQTRQDLIASLDQIPAASEYHDQALLYTLEAPQAALPDIGLDQLTFNDHVYLLFYSLIKFNEATPAFVYWRVLPQNTSKLSVAGAHLGYSLMTAGTFPYPLKTSARILYPLIYSLSHSGMLLLVSSPTLASLASSVVFIGASSCLLSRSELSPAIAPIRYRLALAVSSSVLRLTTQTLLEKNSEILPAGTTNLIFTGATLTMSAWFLAYNILNLYAHPHNKFQSAFLGINSTFEVFRLLTLAHMLGSQAFHADASP